MTSRVIPVQNFVLVVFGATGDLARRKLLPAMFQRDVAGQLPDAASIIGVARAGLTTAEYAEQAAQSIAEHVPAAELGTASVKKFLARLSYVKADAAEDAGWPALAEALAPHAARVTVFYLATAPALFGQICERLARYGLAAENTRVVVEKPVGRDLGSAREVNDAVGAVFPEERVYRIDHYLGKEAVQNLLALRFANAMFEPLWTAAHIDHVQITVAETLGVEGRAGYYDSAGALRDMVQNHMLQLLCLVAMEPPAKLEANALRDEKLKILRSLKPLSDDALCAANTVRGQYRAGASGNGAVPGYLEELGRNGSTTETFAALKVEIGNWRWAGVPFYLRTGKRLPERVSEIVIFLRPIPHSVFSPNAGQIEPNRLVIRLQPDEGIKLFLMSKDPGPGGMRLREVPLDMSFAAAFGVRNPDAYERLVLDVVRGDQTLFMRRDEVEAAWAWIDPILENWAAAAEPPKPYTAGTWGPSAAIALIERDGRTWVESGA